jgi:K+-transporting ATPase KdpF subunit
LYAEAPIPGSDLAQKERSGTRPSKKECVTRSIGRQAHETNGFKRHFPSTISFPLTCLWFLNVALTVFLAGAGNLGLVQGVADERCCFCPEHDCFLCTGNFVSKGLRTSEVKVAIMLGNVLLILISIFLCGYLFYALLKPEKF